MVKFYLDTSIWMDVYENRKGYNNEPLGDFALKLLILLKSRKNRIVISNLLITELEINYSIEKINGMIKPFESLIDKIFATKKQRDESMMVAKERNLPKGDVLHAILARDNNLVLVTRDRHFDKLKDISRYYKPEDII
ncbi:PIN domain-containing protein [Candidatus Woesearchaeota archaeon]|nr:PIN domain-containing protein [Candidatus Woesearchaeota archaeon]